MTEQARNALGALARLPIEQFPDETDDYVLFKMGRDNFITIGHVRDARAALATIVEPAIPMREQNS
jgi:hypothetical protein